MQKDWLTRVYHCPEKTGRGVLVAILKAHVTLEHTISKTCARDHLVIPGAQNLNTLQIVIKKIGTTGAKHRFTCR